MEGSDKLRVIYGSSITAHPSYSILRDAVPYHVISINNYHRLKQVNTIKFHKKTTVNSNNKDYIPAGKFSDTGYWSSSEKNKDASLIQYFFYGNGGNFSKGTKLRVRAVRAF